MVEINEIKDKLESRFSGHRWQHILGVYETAVKLAEINQADKEKTALAALLHDYGKTLTKEELLIRARNYRLSLSEADFSCPDVLHGPVGAKMVEEEFDIRDKEVLQAIASHTLGNDHMSKIDKIVFLADMVEPNRDFPGVGQLRSEVFKDLDRGLLLGLDQTIAYVNSTGRFLHPQTERSRQALLKGLETKKEL